MLLLFLYSSLSPLFLFLLLSPPPHLLSPSLLLPLSSLSPPKSLHFPCNSLISYPPPLSSRLLPATSTSDVTVSCVCVCARARVPVRMCIRYQLPVTASTSNVVTVYNVVPKETPHAVVITVTMPHMTDQFSYYKHARTHTLPPSHSPSLSLPLPLSLRLSPLSVSQTLCFTLCFTHAPHPLSHR